MNIYKVTGYLTYIQRNVVEYFNSNQLSKGYEGLTIMVFELLSILESFKKIFRLNICVEIIKEW